MEKIILGNRVCGLFRHENKVYISFRNYNHYFRKYNGLGISASVLEHLKKLGCRKIIFIYTKPDNTQIKYETYPNKFYEVGTKYRDGENDYQFILSLVNFNMDVMQVN